MIFGYEEVLTRYDVHWSVAVPSQSFFHWSVAVPSQSAWPGSDPHLAASDAYIIIDKKINMI